jgi:hypothetical protein
LEAIAQESAQADGEFQLAAGHDAAAYAAAFARDGRLHIPHLLREADARRLHAAILRTPWHLTLIHDGPKQMPLSQWETLPPERRAAVEAAFAGGARDVTRFNARYLSLHLSADGEVFDGGIPEFAALCRFLNSAPFLAFARTVTGDDSVRLTDAHATCFRAGDFLYRHNDHVPDAERIAAYVLNLTPAWRPEWGGLLNFLDGGHVTRAFTPAWNALNLLKVPQDHFVSAVADFVDQPRLAVSGWLRRR